MLEAILMMGGLGAVVGVGLAAASKIFYVYVDPLVMAVDDALPGANCGGCGLPGCTANAEAIVAGKASPNSCVAAGEEVAVTIAGILGVSIEAKEPDIARPGCYYSVDDSDQKYIYNGLSDCKAASLLSGGMKVCSVGCLGLGSCAKACPFDAIQMGPEGLPVVIDARCTGCGTCERVCPKHIITLSSVTRRILKEYTTEECTTPCQRTCPAGIDIREYIRRITLGDYNGSVRVIKERNPFPTVIGRICPRPCEDECRRKYVDEPVAINYLKRFVADFEKEGNERILPYKAPETGKKIAVIGGGVEGLSTSFFAARLGHSPTIFESRDKMGGLLRSAIAANRLPGEVLDYDIEGILEMGVTAATGKTLGKDFTIESLLNDNEAVFLATGGWDSRLSRRSDDIEELIPGVFLLLDLIKSDSKSHNKINCKSNVLINGGGRLALKAARICEDLGSENITVLFRESRDEIDITDEELEEAADVNIIFEAGITRITGEGKEIADVEYTEFESLTKTVIPVETLFFASGRFPEMIFTKIPEAVEEDEAEGEIEAKEDAPRGPVKWQAMETYKHPASDETGLFAKGDVLSDYSAAIKAIGAGRRAAASIHQVMYGLPVSFPEKAVKPYSVLQNVDKVELVSPSPREIMPLSASAAENCVELEKGFTEEMARKEASRCLQCGLICYEKK